MRAWSSVATAVLTTLAALVVVLFAAGDNAYVLNIATAVCIYGILALGLGVLVGLAGQIAMGHGAIFGIGAYVTSYLALKAGLGFWPALGAAMVVAALAGLLMGLVSLRFEGLFFAIVTFAASAVILSVFQNWRSVTGGANGMSANFDPPPLSLGGLSLSFDTPITFYGAVGAALLAVVAIVSALKNSAFGSACVAIREDEVLARCLSIDAFRYKLAAFVISSALAGFAGGWYATYLKYITPELFTVSLSIEMLMVLIIGGTLHPIAGPLIGSTVFVVLPELLRFTQSFRATMFGLLAILVVLLFPEGLSEALRRAFRRLAARRARAVRS